MSFLGMIVLQTIYCNKIPLPLHLPFPPPYLEKREDCKQTYVTSSYPGLGAHMHLFTNKKMSSTCIDR